MTKIFVISLDNEIGAKRRSKLTYNYEWFKANNEAMPFIQKKMLHFWASKEKCRRGKEGCVDSYYRLCYKIYKEKINDCIIFEDDCHLIDLPNDMPKKLCYLNGLFIDSDSWDKYPDFSIENGLNEINYDKSRILGCWGIYIPKYHDVLPILEMISKYSKHLKAIDIMLMNNQIINHYLYPACSYVDDGGESQISKSHFKEKNNYR
tara:strand:- start:86 stop:703 length:618 start_codon:yes stop_codon:yes gene_type:complete